MFVYKNEYFIIIHDNEVIIFIVFERLTMSGLYFSINLSNTAKFCAMMNNATVRKILVLNVAYIT